MKKKQQIDLIVDLMARQGCIMSEDDILKLMEDHNVDIANLVLRYALNKESKHACISADDVIEGIYDRAIYLLP